MAPTNSNDPFSGFIQELRSYQRSHETLLSENTRQLQELVATTANHEGRISMNTRIGYTVLGVVLVATVGNIVLTLVGG